MKTELQQLTIDLQSETARKHPLFPSAYIPKPIRTDKTANGLTQCIIEYIKMRGGQAERISITGRPHQIGNKIKWTKSHMTKGAADISATINGQSVKIEVKIGTDRQSEKQRQYQAAIERAGGIYYIARNFNDFVKWYKQQWK